VVLEYEISTGEGVQQDSSNASLRRVAPRHWQATNGRRSPHGSWRKTFVSIHHHVHASSLELLVANYERIAHVWYFKMGRVAEGGDDAGSGS
jgi:hypothetical protein